MGIFLLVGGCASVSTEDVQKPAAPPGRPACIYVRNFEAPGPAFRVGRAGENLDAFRRNLSRQLAAETAKRITKRLLPSVALPPEAPLGREPAWLVTGRFVRVNQGSRALRTVVGFGLGGTKLETEVTVFDLSGRTPRPILSFRTTGGSNAMPGAAPGLVVPNLWLLSLDTLVKMGPGLSVDTIRTSRQIVAVLSEYMAQEGFLPPEKVYHAKKLGAWL